MVCGIKTIIVLYVCISIGCFEQLFLNLSLELQVGMPVSNYLSEEMLISLCITLFLGMLPPLGSSTSDPEEELEELRMKLQIMKGE